MNPRALAPAVLLSTTAVLLVVVPAQAGSRYGNPRTGAWKVEASFDSTQGGAMTLSKKRAVTKLVALPSADNAEACGKRIELTGSPKLKSYKQFGGRWALAGVKGGLLVPTAAKLKVDGKKVNGKVKILFNSPTLGTPAEFRHGSCILRFTVRKK